jgi:hypothetical protein
MDINTNQTVCEKWTLCVLGRALGMDCPPGNVFNAEKNQCMLKGIAPKPCGILAISECMCCAQFDLEQWRR